MRVRRRLATAALVATMATLGAACGGDDDEDTGAAGGGEAASFDDGTTMKAIKDKGKLVVGTKFDQPLFGQKAPSGDVEGFDTEIARELAAVITGSRDKIEFVEAVSKNREPFIEQGKVDIVVATYTINDKRKEVVSFAGPYYIAGQDIMVKADDDSVKGIEDLNGKKVCSVEGSTSEANVKEQAPQAEVLLFDTYSQCAEALGDGRVVAVSTDNIILLGLVKDNPGKFKLVKSTFTTEPYGIGVKKGDDDFRTFINDVIEKSYKDGSWKEAFDATVGEAGEEAPTPPNVDRYTATAAATPTTAAGGSGSSTTTGGSSGSSTSTTSATSSGSSSSSSSSTTKP